MVIEIVKMNPPSKRKISDMICLKHVLKDIPFFQQLTEEKGADASKQFCKNVLYSFFKKDEILFNQGEIVERFYVLLSGKVSIVVNHQETIINSKGEEVVQVDTEEVSTIESGNSIGDLSALKDSKRNAGIVCREDSHFLVLEKDDFNKIVADMEMREMANKITFMQQLQLFENFSRRQIELSMVYFVKQKVNKGFFICEEDTMSNFVYIIRRGEFRVSKQFKVDRQQDPFSTKQSSSKEQIIVMKERQITKTIEMATLCEGEICCEVDAIEDKPQFFTIQCISQTAEHFFKRVIGEFYDLLKFRSTFIKDKLIWRSLRMQIVKRTLQNHSALLGGIYPKKNLISSHAPTEPYELVRRNTKQLDMYDKQVEVKSAKGNTINVKSKRSKSGNAIQEKVFVLPKVFVHSICDISSLPEIISRNNSSIDKKSPISIQNTTTTLYGQIQIKRSPVQTPKIITLELQHQNQQKESNLINVMSTKDQQISTANQLNQHSSENSKSVITKKINNQQFQKSSPIENQRQQQKLEEEEVKPQGNSILLLDSSEQTMNKSIQFETENNRRSIEQTYGQYSTYQGERHKQKFLRANSLLEDKNKIFQNEKLQKVYTSSASPSDCKDQRNLIFRRRKSNNQEEQIEKKKNNKIILLSKKGQNGVCSEEHQDSIQLQFCNTESTANHMTTESSLGHFQQNLDGFYMESKLNHQLKDDYNKNYLNKFNYLSKGLAECPKQDDSKYMELYKVNLIESFDIQSNNYQEYYQRHYFKPGSTFVQSPTTGLSSRSTPKNSFIKQKNNPMAQKQFNAMYSYVPNNDNNANSCNVSNTIQNSSPFIKQAHTPQNLINSKSRSEQSSHQKENKPRNSFDKLSPLNNRLDFIQKSDAEADDEEDEEDWNQKNDLKDIYSPVNEIEDLEKILQKKREICQTQEKKIISHLKMYKQSEANLPVSQEENQAISNSLMRLLKTKFGKNQSQITTADWRYNTSLIFTPENDIANQPNKSKQQSILMARQRKNVIALKQKIRSHQSGTNSAQSTSPLNSRRRSNLAQYGNAVSSSNNNQDEEIQSIKNQIKLYKEQKYISQIKKNQEFYQTQQNQFFTLPNKSSICSGDENLQSLKNNPSLVSNKFKPENIVPGLHSTLKRETNTARKKHQKAIVQLNTLDDWSKSWYLQQLTKGRKDSILSHQDETQDENDKFDLTVEKRRNRKQSNNSASDSIPQTNEDSIHNQHIYQSNSNGHSSSDDIRNSQINPNSTHYFLTNNTESNQQNIINNRSFIPQISRKLNKKSDNIQQSPSRPRRVVNIKVKYNPNPNKEILNRTFHEQLSINNQNSPIKKLQLTSNKKDQITIPELKINKIKKDQNQEYKPLSQVEIWDSRNFTLPNEMNGTFYKYNTPLKNRKFYQQQNK